MNNDPRRRPAQAPRVAADPQVAAGYDMLRADRLAEAIRHAEALATGRGDDVHVLVLAAESHFAAGDAEAALAWTERAVVASGADPFLKLRKARLLGLLRRRDEIPALAEEVAAVAEGNGRLLWQLAVLYQRNNWPAEAIATFERARALPGVPPGLLYELATARFFSGDFEAAERDLDAMLALAPQSGSAMYLRSTLRRQTAERNHVDALRRVLASPIRRAEDEAAILYALGKELEDLGDHAASFDAVARGAGKRRGCLRYDAAAELRAIDAIRETWTADAMAGVVEGEPDPGAIFIVGMPRTGTTLAERLLVQSGQVGAAGELMDFGNLLGNATGAALARDAGRSAATAALDVDFPALGRAYLRGARQLADGKPRVLDKMPVNFLYCGMIAKALPEARIIHLVRDPLDSCYAVFKTLFFDSYSFSYDLGELGDYYIAYHRLMQHWHQVMPGRILDVRYANLVTDTAREAERMYAWCDLPWDPAVLEAPTSANAFSTASAAQVREPVHTRSLGSARRHLEALRPLADRLRAAGIDLD